MGSNRRRWGDKRRNLHFFVAYFFVFLYTTIYYYMYWPHIYILKMYFKNTFLQYFFNVFLKSKRSFNKDIFQCFCESHIFVLVLKQAIQRELRFSSQAIFKNLKRRVYYTILNYWKANFTALSSFHHFYGLSEWILQRKGQKPTRLQHLISD